MSVQASLQLFQVSDSYMRKFLAKYLPSQSGLIMLSHARLRTHSKLAWRKHVIVSHTLGHFVDLCVTLETRHAAFLSKFKPFARSNEHETNTKFFA